MGSASSMPVASGSSKESADRIAVCWGEKPPANAFSGSVALLGVFIKTGKLVNGHPCYANELWPEAMLWFSPNQYWSIGTKDNLGSGTSGVHCMQPGVPLPEMITGPWHISDTHNQEWLTTDTIRITVLPPASNAPPTISSHTRPQSMTESLQQVKKVLDVRAGNARDQYEAAAEAKFKELINLAFEDYAADRIDEAELARRKKAAREEAMPAERDKLARLELASRAYEAATVEAEALEQRLADALTAADEAAFKVDEALRNLHA